MSQVIIILAFTQIENIISSNQQDIADNVLLINSLKVKQYIVCNVLLIGGNYIFNLRDKIKCC